MSDRFSTYFFLIFPFLLKKQSNKGEKEGKEEKNLSADFLPK